MTCWSKEGLLWASSFTLIYLTKLTCTFSNRAKTLSLLICPLGVRSSSARCGVQRRAGQFLERCHLCSWMQEDFQAKNIGNRPIISSLFFLFMRWFDLLTMEVCGLCSCTWLGCQHWHTQLPTLLRGQAPETMSKSRRRRKIPKAWKKEGEKKSEA